MDACRAIEYEASSCRAQDDACCRKCPKLLASRTKLSRMPMPVLENFSDCPWRRRDWDVRILDQFTPAVRTVSLFFCGPATCALFLLSRDATAVRRDAEHL